MRALWTLGALSTIVALLGACTDDRTLEPEEPLLRSAASVQAASLAMEAELGKALFFDVNLSINGDQACASCHGPEVGFSGPESFTNAAGAVYEGSIPGRFGNRKPPSAAYATPSPILHFVMEKDGPLFIGGNFWDGRATGEVLGNPAADQALGPFLNPVEQGLSDAACVVYRACTASYPITFDQVYPGLCTAIVWPPAGDVATACAAEGTQLALSPESRAKVDEAYSDIGLAIKAYEASSEVNAYTSKYDYYLAGMVRLTKQERKGLNIFKSKGKCANCHILDEGPNGEPPLLTDFTFDNLGVPRNPANSWYTMPAEFNPDGANWIDYGLGAFLETRGDYSQFAEENVGKQKVPTLRNVDRRPYTGFVKAYGHNGYFKSLEQIVHFYNTRDVKPTCPNPLTSAADAMTMGCWPAPEVEENVNDDELGNLHLTPAQEEAIVAFLKTLSDGYVP